MLSVSEEVKDFALDGRHVRARRVEEQLHPRVVEGEARVKFQRHRVKASQKSRLVDRDFDTMLRRE